MSEGLSKSERIRSEGRISILFSEGRRGSVGPVKYLWRTVAIAPFSEQVARIPVCADKSGVAVMFSVPKKAFKKAWKRNLIKRRMKESYRRRKEALAAKTVENGVRIDIAFICAGIPVPGEKSAKKRTPIPVEIPDFKTIDDAIAKILEQILTRN